MPSMSANKKKEKFLFCGFILRVCECVFCKYTVTLLIIQSAWWLMPSMSANKKNVNIYW